MASLPYCISEKRNSVATIAFDEFLNVAADDNGSLDVVARRREGEFDGDFFLASAEKMTFPLSAGMKSKKRLCCCK